MYDELGTSLEALCRAGHVDAVLVAPFIKRAVLTRLLSALPASVRLLCVTRWRPEEVAAGVSDPDIWLDIRDRENADLRLCPSLHAKYYRVDGACFIGSANLTATALGWSAAPNLEILCPFGGAAAEWMGFEHQLSLLSVPCKEVIYQQMKETADLLKAEMNANAGTSGAVAPLSFVPSQLLSGRAADTGATPTGVNGWLPRSREPADLYLVYSNQASSLTVEARTAAAADMVALEIPFGLAEPLFRRFVSVQLLQAPCVDAVDTFVSRPQRFGAVRAYLNSLPCSGSPGFNSTRAWQILMRWLLYFIPERYEHSVPNHSEVFRIRQ